VAYKNIHENFWRDEDIKKLPRDARHFLFYLITCPSSHYSGIFYIPFPTITFESGFTEREIRKNIDTLSIGYPRVKTTADMQSKDKFFLKYDIRTSVIWIRNMLKYQAFMKKQSDKLITGLRNYLISLPISPLLHDFSQYYAEFKLPFFAPESIPYPLLPYKTEEETETKAKESNTHTFPREFLEFWEAYPERNGKKLEKAKALDYFIKFQEEEWPLIIQAAKNYRACMKILLMLKQLLRTLT